MELGEKICGLQWLRCTDMRCKCCLVQKTGQVDARGWTSVIHINHVSCERWDLTLKLYPFPLAVTILARWVEELGNGAPGLYGQLYFGCVAEVRGMCIQQLVCSVGRVEVLLGFIYRTHPCMWCPFCVTVCLVRHVATFDIVGTECHQIGKSVMAESLFFVHSLLFFV